MGKLRGFHDALDPAGQAMLGTILDGAITGETGGYRKSFRRYGDPEEGEAGQQQSSSGWNDLIGWIEEQGEEDTQGVRKHFR